MLSWNLFFTWYSFIHVHTNNIMACNIRIYYYTGWVFMIIMWGFETFRGSYQIFSINQYYFFSSPSQFPSHHYVKIVCLLVVMVALNFIIIILSYISINYSNIFFCNGKCTSFDYNSFAFLFYFFYAMKQVSIFFFFLLVTCFSESCRAQSIVIDPSACDSNVYYIIYLYYFYWINILKVWRGYRSCNMEM